MLAERAQALGPLAHWLTSYFARPDGSRRSANIGRTAFDSAELGSGSLRLRATMRSAIAGKLLEGNFLIKLHHSLDLFDPPAIGITEAFFETMSGAVFCCFFTVV